MSTHFEGCDVHNSSVTLEKPLTEIGEYQIPPGKYAISINYDEVFYIEGTPEELEGWATAVTRLAAQARAHSQAPLQAEDFEWDGDDSAYTCPRCETIFEPADYQNYDGLMKAISVHVGEHEKEAGRGN